MDGPARVDDQTPFSYRISGLRVASAIALPGAIALEATGAEPEVTIRR